MSGVRPYDTDRLRGSDPMTRRDSWGLTLFAVLFCAACGPSGGTQISQSGKGAFDASVIPTGDGFAVAWHDTRDGNQEIYLRLLNAMGEPVGQEHRLTSSPERSDDADIQPARDNFAVAWSEEADGRRQARLGVWSPDGKPLWSNTLSSAESDGRNPILRRDGNGLMALWIEDLPASLANSKDRPWESEVWASWWSADGKVLRVPRMLAAAGKTTSGLSAGIDGRGWAWVMFDAKAGTKSEELFVARTNGSVVEVAVLTADDGVPSKSPELEFSSDGRAAVTWYDERGGNQEVYLFAGRMSEFLEERAFRVTETDGRSIAPYLAWNGRRIGVAWADDSDGQYEVYFRPFSDAGAPLARATRLTDNPTASVVPAIRPSGTGFALVWNEVTGAPDGSDASPASSEIAFAAVR
jgi:hypothetical protein